MTIHFLLLLVSNRNQQRMYKDNYDQPYKFHDPPRRDFEF